MALNAGPTSIPALVLQRAAAHGGATILRKKDRGIWRSVTWSALGDSMRNAALALRAIGFGRGNAGAVMAETRPEWAIADLGIQAAGGVSAGIPPDCSAARLGALLRETACTVLFVENEEQLDKALEVRGDCPALRCIVIFDMKGLRDFADDACQDFAGFMARGAQSDAAGYEAGVAAIGAGDPAIVLLPAGAPCGARMLTHGEVLHAVAGVSATLRPRDGDQRVALLPLADRIERIHGLYCALDSGTISNFLENADTGLENLQEVQPTLLVTDAAMWRMMHDRIAAAAAAATPVHRGLYRWGIATALRRGAAASIARRLVLHPVRRELGMARLRVALVGDAPPAPEVAGWVEALGIAVRCVDSDVAPDRAAGTAAGALTVEA